MIFLILFLSIKWYLIFKYSGISNSLDGGEDDNLEVRRYEKNKINQNENNDELYLDDYLTSRNSDE